MNVRASYNFILMLSLGFLCSSCVYLGKSEFYNEAVDSCFYLENNETLSILFGIDKCCNPWFKSILPPELQVRTVRQKLYIIEIRKNGTISLGGYILNTPMSGFYTAPGIYLLRIDNGILIFDYCKSYLLRDNKLFHCEDNALLSNLMNGYYDVKRRTLLDWNAKRGYCYGEIRGLYYHREFNFNWKKTVITLTVKRGKRSDNETIITIACPEVLNYPVRLVVPKEYTYSHFPPNDKELPYLALGGKGIGTSSGKLVPNVLCLNKKRLTVNLENMLSEANQHQDPVSDANIHSELK